MHNTMLLGKNNEKSEAKTLIIMCIHISVASRNNDLSNFYVFSRNRRLKISVITLHM